MKFVKDLGKLTSSKGIRTFSLWECSECKKQYKRETSVMKHNNKEESICAYCYQKKRLEKALTKDKKCVKCNITKSNEDFYFKNKEKTHRGNVCKECKIKENHEWAKRLPQETKAKYRRTSHAKSYGLTLEAMNNYFQDASCGICNSKGTEKNILVLDHCHSTGKIRGVLCNNCNRALGLFRDNTDILESAIKWLGK